VRDEAGGDGTGCDGGGKLEVGGEGVIAGSGGCRRYCPDGGSVDGRDGIPIHLATVRIVGSARWGRVRSESSPAGDASLTAKIASISVQGCCEVDPDVGWCWLREVAPVGRDRHLRGPWRTSRGESWWWTRLRCKGEGNDAMDTNLFVRT
jgi:hypothetical protein